MDFKQLFQKYMEKIKKAWKNGKIQRTSRISYDVIWNVILFFLIIGAAGLFFAGGVGAGYFASLVKDEPVRSYDSMEKDIYNYEETSKLYFDGSKYFGDVRSDIYREEVSLDQVSDFLKDAVISTEDQNFNKHKGVVPKAVIRAVVQEATNAPIKTGGSTLTQQLIKNQILTNEVSFERKAKEILLALRLERFFNKDQILEAYLNIIPYGREASGQIIAGVQTAATGIFGVDASEVNLPQAAYLAGLPQSPSYYTPFASGGGLKDEEGLEPGIERMKTVLKRMYDEEYITKEQFDKALDYDIVADFTERSESPIEKYPYLTYEVEKRAKEILMEKLVKDDGYTMDDIENDEKLKEEYSMLAERAMRKNGYNIHTTINKKIFDKFQEIVKNYKQYGPDWTGYVTDEDGTGKKKITQKIQTGGILIENKSGKIISFVGGRGFSLENQLNYATTERPNGSTMKPLLDYGPAMEAGVVQPGTPILDYRTTFAGGYTPGNYTGGYNGLVSARDALAKSYNIPAVWVYSNIVNSNPAKQYLDKMGITSLTAGDYENLSMALGQPTYGISVEENTNAFATFGNGGKFVDAYMIERITTNDGDVIYEHKGKPVDVFTPQSNYLTIDMMRDVISGGTAAFLNSQLKYGGVDWAGKTGTSQDWKDTWFVATNPNVTFGTWMGYKIPKSLQCSSCSLGYSNRNVKLWAQLINAATDIKPDLLRPTNSFERPGGLVSRSYCAISGMLPSELCQKAGLVKTDLFNAKYVPTKKDDSLISGTYIMVDGKAVIAGPNTPKEFTDGDGITFNPEFLKRMGYDKYNDISVLFPRTNRELWEKISVPSSKLGEALQDDGKNPSTPTAVSASGSTLSWKKSGSKDVVGYRIFRASKPGEPFELIGNTTSTNYAIAGSPAIYHVKAVDYFGLESNASNEVVFGDVKESEKRPDKQPNKEKPDKNDNNNENENNESDDDANNRQNDDGENIQD